MQHPHVARLPKPALTLVELENKLTSVYFISFSPGFSPVMSNTDPVTVLMVFPEVAHRSGSFISDVNLRSQRNR
jgi:hypothetical protein